MYDKEYLAHYGVIGMKWGVRHNPQRAYEKASNKAAKYNKKIQKHDTKARKQLSKGAKAEGRMWLFRDKNEAKKHYEKSRVQTARAVRQAEKGAKWIKRMEKEFAKQSTVSIDKSITDLGKAYAERVTSMADRIYVDDIRR